MNALSGYRGCLAAAVFATGLLVCSTKAYGQEMSWVPVAASGGNVIEYAGAGVTCPSEPTTIMLVAGYDYVVEFELRMAGWSEAPEAPTLGVYQAYVDSTGFGDATPHEGPHGGLDGCFIGVKLCHFFDTGSTSYVPCDSDYCNVWAPGDPSCPGSDPTCTDCLDNPYFVFTGILETKAVSTSDPNYAWGAVTRPGECKTDPGCPSMYGGTLMLDVPSTARGTSTIAFDPATASTFFLDCAYEPIPDVTLTPGQIILVTGRCCTYEWPGPVCEDGLTEAECGYLHPDWVAGRTCADCGCYTCFEDSNCYDGNACTDDWCYYPPECGSECRNDPNYDTLTECCDPITGQRTIIDDGDPCTEDDCDEWTGEVSHFPVCDDGDPCTHDICTFDGSVECDYPLSYNPDIHCCEYDNGNVAFIDDGNPCTADTCDPATGQAVHDPVDAGTLCDDGLTCVVDEVCSAAGECLGTDVNTIPCTGDGHCPAGTCDLGAGLCSCLNPPLPAPPPHDQRKNRYISFAPMAFNGQSVAVQVELTASTYFPDSTGVLGWVGAPDEHDVSRVVADPVYRVWGELVINAGDCEIVPVATYALRAIVEGSPEGNPASYSDPLLVETIAKPGVNYWADGVGILEPVCSTMLTPCADASECLPGEVCGVWGPPDGFINFNDVTAAVFAFQQAPGLAWPDTTRVDLHGDEFGNAIVDPPNYVVNFSDIQQMVLAFQANPYPYSDPADCP